MKDRERKHMCTSRDGSIRYSYDSNFIYAEDKAGLRRLDLFEGRYFKLRLWRGVPILEIDGLRMHLVRDFESPLDYAKEVVTGLRIPPSGSATVLDTCMGLGYTALEAAARPGVAKVVTFEIFDAVLTLAKWNPFSEGLFDESGKVETHRGSATALIKRMEDSSFDFIIHDPPRFSHAPELYSNEFYRDMFRVCRPGAKLFHYVGSVGISRGRKMEDEASKRLAEAGFFHIHYSKRLQGIFAEKPPEGYQGSDAPNCQ